MLILPKYFLNRYQFALRAAAPENEASENLGASHPLSTGVPSPGREDSAVSSRAAVSLPQRDSDARRLCFWAHCHFQVLSASSSPWYVHASHARFPGSFTQQPWSPVDPSGGMANLFPVPAIKLMCPRGAEAGQLCQKPLRYPLLRLRVPTPCFSAGWHTPMWPGSAYTECVLTIFFFFAASLRDLNSFSVPNDY